MDNQTCQHQNIVLIGFMGSGKTTVGQRLASQLSWEFLDSDHEIEKNTGTTIKEIFRSQGEAAFREIERQTIEKLCTNQSRKVISLGGGAFTQKAVREVCLRTSTVVYLALSWETWKKRRDELIEDRPLLQTNTLEEVQKLYQTRIPVYSQCHIKIDTDTLTPEQVAKAIMDQITTKSP